MNRLQRELAKALSLSAQAIRAGKLHDAALKELAKAQKKAQRAEDKVTSVETDLYDMVDCYVIDEDLNGFMVGVMLNIEKPDESKVTLWTPDKDDPASNITWSQLLDLYTLLGRVINGEQPR